MLVTRDDSIRLIKYGFYDSKKASAILGADKFKDKTHEERAEICKSIGDLELQQIAEHEIAEETKDHFIRTPFPEPMKRFRLFWETYNLSIEEAYYWVLQYCERDMGYTTIIKTEDVFSASENSAFFGVAQQRIGLQQDKVSQFLATIGKMVKELFQLVRELRVLDERLDYYRDSYLEDRKVAEPAEITLKGIYIDMVEQGAKNPSSVYGMARELQFTTLPDLFFSTHPINPEDVEKIVDTERAGFNRKVREVLKRKLYGFLKWKEKTYAEMKTRRTFTLKYFSQHYEIIKMYMEWVRPYLRHIKRLTMDDSKTTTPDLISAFEGSILEIEFIAYQQPMGHIGGDKGSSVQKMVVPDFNKGAHPDSYYAVVLHHFIFRTRPAMSFQQEGYQRGPVHVGRMQWDSRGYTWKKKQIDAYLAMKDSEDLELMKSISGSVKAAMEALGTELEAYLREARGEKEKAAEPSAPAKKPGMLDPFVAPIKGVGELFGALVPKKSAKKATGSIKSSEKEAKSWTKRSMWETYKNFKKAHKMMAW